MKSIGQVKSYWYSARNLVLVATAMVVIFFLLLLVAWQFNSAVGSRSSLYYLAFASGLALAGMAALLLVFRMWQEITRLQEQVREAQKKAEETDQRLKAVLRLSQKFVEASDEDEVVEEMLAVSVDLSGALGATFVPLDDRGQPLTAVNHGDFPAPVINSWVEYLASPAVREQCGACQDHGTLVNTCPLLPGPFSEAVGLYCLPLKRGEKEFGVLNLYLARGIEIRSETKAFLRAMMDETALALEGVRLRRRELAALRQLHALQRRTELKGLLVNFLENVRDTLKADFAHLEVRGTQLGQPRIILSLGEAPDGSGDFVEGVIHRILEGEQVLSIEAGQFSGPYPRIFRHTIAVPLVPQDGGPVGAILAANLRDQSFNKRQQSLLQAVAGQVAQLIQSTQLMADLEYKTLMAERTRLAREIHDGLAQTIGFLKLQTAQMQNYLAQGLSERLQESLEATHKILAEAYLDARQAIDGLRLSSEDYGFSRWLEQAVEEFRDTSGLEVELSTPPCSDELPPEVQAQLIRILQEALSNIRKHARADKVWLSYRQDNGDLFLEIRDNGVGFSPEDVPGSSRYGLQGMLERTELIGAEFQVISKPLEGTIVRVRLPSVIGENTQ